MTGRHPTDRCWAEIDCAALRHNAAMARELAGPGTAVLAIVKANGYGHGMVPAAREFAAGAGGCVFGVTCATEAAELQQSLPEAAITIMATALPTERAEIVRQRWLPWISSQNEAAAYARLTNEVHGEGAAPFEIEIGVDTGMGRMGVLESGLEALRQAVGRLPSLRLTGISTHLPVSDEDRDFTLAQLERFQALANAADGHLPGRRQAQNSAGLIGYRRAECNAVRPGLMLYGSSPLGEFQPRLRPALTLKTRLTLVRDLPAGRGISYGRTFITPQPMRIGTLAAGYADGYPRHLSNTGAAVIVRGRRCALLGRVTMDQMMIDLSALPEVGAGEEVILLGQQGSEEILAAELAERAGTIPWEIFTSLAARVTRYYLDPTPEAP
jgi:alanine racemase